MHPACATALVILGLGCGLREPAPTPSAEPAPQPAAAAEPIAKAEPAPEAKAEPEPIAKTEPEPEPEAKAEPAPAPPEVPRTGTTWPYHAWDRAEAVTFNQFSIRPGVQLLAYAKAGWSPHVVDKKALSEPQAREAVDLVRSTQGGVEVSKCAFPRHAVVLFSGDVPVASINVCFECGDIVLWPTWGPEPDWSAMSDKQMKEFERRMSKQMKLYDKVFPRWQAFFRDDLGFSIDPPPR